MLRSIAVVALIALGDSLNPTTIGPAVYLALGESAARRVLEFAAGAFIVYFAGGALLLVGPGHLILDALPHPERHKRHLLELAGGVALLIAAAVIWILRKRLARRGLPGAGGGRSGGPFIAGATIMLAELPTAVPYFAAITVIAGAGGLVTQLLLLLLFNVLFVAPLIAIAIVVEAAPAARRTVIEPVGAWLGRHWPTVFAILAAVLGAGLVAGGIAGLAGE